MMYFVNDIQLKLEWPLQVLNNVGRIGSEGNVESVHAVMHC